MREMGKIVLMSLSVALMSCGGDDDEILPDDDMMEPDDDTGDDADDEGPQLSGDAVLGNLTDEEAVLLCEESNASLEPAAQSFTISLCYFDAVEASIDDPSLDCEMIAANCIANPSPDVIVELADCTDSNLTADFANCTASVETLRTCNETQLMNAEMFADGLTCMNFADRIGIISAEVPACTLLETECPDF